MKIILIFSVIFVTNCLAFAEKSFTIDYENDSFLMDGKPFRYISGSLHYFRVPKIYWKDRMLKYKAAGLNAIQTYIEWSSHELTPGVYNFEGSNDIKAFLDTASEVGLYVILRPGPYICAERDMGGFPYWLLKDRNIALRTQDPIYMKYFTRWMGVLLQKIEPQLYKNGGPIITVQVENEYGQFDGCDYTYLNAIRDLLWKYLGKDVVLFRTDIPDSQYYRCDNIDGVFPAADFGPATDVQDAFSQVRLFFRKGPLVVAEYYTGWMDHWGQPHATVDINKTCSTLDAALAMGASVNMYMFHGGTNFGFSNGANAPILSQPTSYDYAAPLSEAGDPTPLYDALRKIISKYSNSVTYPLPVASEKMELGPHTLNWVGSLVDIISDSKAFPAVYSTYPMSFEDLDHPYGFVAYSALVRVVPPSPAVLAVPGLRDQGYVFVDGQFAGVLSRLVNLFQLGLFVSRGQVITIVVENAGRINYGKENVDPKGIISNVTLGSTTLTKWMMQPIDLNKIIESIDNDSIEPSDSISRPGFFRVNFTIPKDQEILDTFLDPTGWRKGIAFLNGFNLGRYWPAMGPQVTLYVPANIFNPYPKPNILTFLELEHEPVTCSRRHLIMGESCSIKFSKTPILDGQTPSNFAMPNLYDIKYKNPIY